MLPYFNYILIAFLLWDYLFFINYLGILFQKFIARILLLKALSTNRLIIICSVIFTLFYNFKFFKDMVTSYGFGGLNPLYFLSSVILLISLMTLLFLIFSSKYILKPLLITLFVVSSFTAYFMDSYSVVIDSEMIRNSLQTNLKPGFCNRIFLV